VVIVVGAAFWYRRPLRPRVAVQRFVPGRPDVEIGSRLCGPDGKPWCEGCTRAVILFGSATCPSCVANVGFEARLRSSCGELGFPVFYVLPPGPDHDSLAKSLYAGGVKVLRSDLPFFGVSRTPSMIAVDRSGMVQAMWTGNVPDDHADTVLGELTTGASAPLYSRATRRDLDEIAKASAYELLVFNTAKATWPSGTRYRFIPGGELAIRAEYELHKNVPIIADCSTAASGLSCQENLLTLANSGFTRLIALDLPRQQDSPSCRAQDGKP